jgi:hypothetical protein
MIEQVVYGLGLRFLEQIKGHCLVLYVFKELETHRGPVLEPLKGLLQLRVIVKECLLEVLN